MACFGLQDKSPHRVAVLSAHLDDGVLSLGASIRDAVHSGNQVAIVTVFAGDPHSTKPAGRWDARTGFATAGEAVTVRREEDRKACGRLGAEAVWLPYVDGDYGGSRSDDEISARLTEALLPYDAVLVPGRPLLHPDHLWLARCVNENGIGHARIGFYAELPYDLWGDSTSRVTPKGPEIPDAWISPPVSIASRIAKWHACGDYSSQLPWLGRGRRYRLALLRSRTGCEQVTWAA